MTSSRDDVIRTMLADGSTLKAIGDHLGVSRERVRQLAGRIGVRSPRHWGKLIGEAKLKAAKSSGSKSKNDISLNRLRELLHYDRFTGVWTWRDQRGKMPPGSVAGSRCTTGYIQIRIDRKLYMAHVLAWFYSFEQWPAKHIDHQNRIKDDNRLDNLRQGTYSQNFGNVTKRKANTSGFKGVYPHGTKWRAECGHVKLGTYDTPEQAAEAYFLAASIRYGEHAHTDS